jgi:hypothetical protein
MKAAETSDEDMVAALSSIYSSRAVGKELQMDVDTHGHAQASTQEVGGCITGPASPDVHYFILHLPSAYPRPCGA